MLTDPGFNGLHVFVSPMSGLHAWFAPSPDRKQGRSIRAVVSACVQRDLSINHQVLLHILGIMSGSLSMYLKVS